MGESEGIEYELKLTRELRDWLSRMVGWDNWRFEEVADEFDHHWHAYDKAKEGQPVGLKFWFSDKRDAATTKLVWDNR